MNVAVPVPSITPQIPLTERSAVAFAGGRGDFLGLVVRGGLLQVPTVGFYRFWLITDVRRHLWGHTLIGRESLEYTGTGRELLIGFMIALAVLAPIYVVYFALGLAAERLQAFASVPLFLILYVFGQYAAYRARRYRATRTIFRGVRFWMTGSAWLYAGKTFLWDMATLFTLGLALPWRMAALERYKMRNTHFGDLPGDFAATGGTLFRRGIGLWILALALPIIVAAMIAAAVAGSAPELWPLITIVGAVAALGLPLIYVLFRATVTRWLIEGVRFGAVSFESALRRGAVLACYVKWLLAVLAWGIAFATIGFAALVLRAGGVGKIEGVFAAGWTSHVLDIAGVVLFYLLFLLGVGVLKRYFLDRGLWAAVAASTTVVNLAAADRVKAAGEAAGSLGEGLADALDVGAI
jgi:uncharacterized membrane protein YjgN (DUF898 family)